MLGEPDLSPEQERILHDAVCGLIRPISELASQPAGNTLRVT
jgi:hypothetical protein